MTVIKSAETYSSHVEAYCLAVWLRHQLEVGCAPAPVYRERFRSQVRFAMMTGQPIPMALS